MKQFNSIVVLGPTASGKTRLACALAHALKTEIISADSRQVYKHLDIGTGKDLHEYRVKGVSIPVHLINVREPSEQFYLHEFVDSLIKVSTQLLRENKYPIVCGGTGLYLDAIRKDFSFTQIPEDPALREQLQLLSKEELLARVQTYPPQHRSHLDLNSKKRLIRGIEINEFFKAGHVLEPAPRNPLNPYYLGIRVEKERMQASIEARLKHRLDHGLVEEVQSLLQQGLTHERLHTLGLEYKFVSQYVLQELTRDEMISRLQTAIFQFAKRQMTWFRKMEKEGIRIHWVNPETPVDSLLRGISFQPFSS